MKYEYIVKKVASKNKNYLKNSIRRRIAKKDKETKEQLIKLISTFRDNEEDIKKLKTLALKNENIDVRIKALEKLEDLDYEDSKFYKKVFRTEYNPKSKSLAMKLVGDQRWLKEKWAEHKTSWLGELAASLITDIDFLKNVVLQKSNPKTVENILKSIDDKDALYQIFLTTEDKDIKQMIRKKLNMPLKEED